MSPREGEVGLIAGIRTRGAFDDVTRGLSVNTVRMIDAAGEAVYVRGRLWERLGIAQQIVTVAEHRQGPGRRVDPAVVERVIFAMVANRLSATPLSKLAGCSWVANRVFIPGPGRGQRRRLLPGDGLLPHRAGELQEVRVKP